MKGKVVYIEDLFIIRDWDEYNQVLYFIRRWRSGRR